MMRITLLHIVCLLLFVCSCSNESAQQYQPTPLNLDIPPHFEQSILPPVIPVNNPITVEGVALGKKLFFDPILSGDNTQACATCHAPQRAFTDETRFSDGIDGFFGTRNAMPLFNLAWNYNERFAWDGRELSLERQAFEPVSNPIEMHSDWAEVAERLQQHNEYPILFEQVFGVTTIDSVLVTKAIAQFERTLISGNSRFDKYTLGEIELSPQELSGLDVFMNEAKGDCFHCHGNPNNPLWTDNIFHNNGLDATFTDLGLGDVTSDPADNGKFKSPSLRNLAFTAPYMHDGRFETLDEVINFYSEGLQNSPTIDPLMKKIDQGGVRLLGQDKSDLKVFLLSLTDEEFIINPAFQNQ